MEKEKIKIIAKNKNIFHDYFVLEELECGIVLYGTEIKSIRQGKTSIQEAYCQVKDGILYIYDMHISSYEQGNIFNHKEKRDRVLLAHHKEIRKFAQKVKLDGLTIIPIVVYLNQGLAKVKIGLCKGKKQYDKREDMKKEDARRQVKASREKY